MGLVVDALVLSDSVERGADLLDQKEPGWYARVSKEINDDDMISMDRCVLGQLYGDFDDGRKVLGLNPVQADNHGFAYERGISRYWRRVIRRRRESKANFERQLASV